MSLEEALASGAMALFGEKYGARVCVVKIGDFSTELCGGTHLDATGQLGFFKVSEEGAVASGVRRIEAVAGTAAVEAVARQERVLKEIGDILKIAPAEAPQRLRKLLDEQKALERQLQEMEGRLARSKADDLVSTAREVNGVAVIAGRIDGLDPDGLRAVADTLRDRLGSGIVSVGSVVDGKVNLIAAVTRDLTKRFQAGKLIQEMAKVVGGRGGGRPDLAQAGGPDASRVDAALALAYEWVGRQSSRG
jgi:alanyl-tRNA synthetase